jgi:flagellar basal-body rod protein FlgG
MIRSLWTGSTGMKGQEHNISVISNNLANVNTNSFKKSRAEFSDLLYQHMREPGTPIAGDLRTPVGIEIGSGVMINATQKIFEQGEFLETRNSYDLLIEGDGFFQVQSPEGNLLYTRDGSFKKDLNGDLVTSDGYRLEPAINIPPDATEVIITRLGVVTVSRNNELEEVGQLQLVRFPNNQGLKSVGRNFYEATPISGEPIGPANPGENGIGFLTQGFLETSNVKAVEEMVNMITAQRAYEMNSKTIQTSDTMLQTATNLKR